MKTSELLSKLEALNKEVPFDAEIVSGDNWMPTTLVSVHHEPPHTFLEFDWPEEESEEIQENVEYSNPQHQAQLQVMLTAYLDNLAVQCAEGQITPAKLASQILGLVNHTLAFGDHELEGYLLQHSKS